jgi:hypothetical protein
MRLALRFGLFVGGLFLQGRVEEAKVAFFEWMRLVQQGSKVRVVGIFGCEDVLERRSRTVFQVLLPELRMLLFANSPQRGIAYAHIHEASCVPDPRADHEPNGGPTSRRVRG